MLKQRRVSAMGVLASLFTLVAGGVATADPLAQEKDAAGNRYHMKLSMENVVIQSVPNMAAAPFVREGYVTATTRLEITCNSTDCPDPDPEIVSAAVAVSAQVGCPTDLSEGLKNMGPSATLQGGLPPTLAGLLPQGSDVTNINITPTVQSATPGSFAATVRPGYITDVLLGRKTIPPTGDELEALQRAATLANKVWGDLHPLKQTDEQKNRAAELEDDFKVTGQQIQNALNPSVTGAGRLVVAVTNRHLVVDRNNTSSLGACGGPVAVRMYAQAWLKTRTSSDKVDMYGDIYTL